MLIACLVLGGCSEEERKVMEQAQYELVENAVFIKYVDSNCLIPVMAEQDLHDGFIAFDYNNLYERDESNYIYQNRSYFEMLDDRCLGAFLDETGRFKWAAMKANPLPDNYKVIDGELYLESSGF